MTVQRVPLEFVNYQKFNDQDVIKSWEWFISFLSANDWQRRKRRIEQNISINFRETKPFSEPLTEGTLIRIKDDVIGWYLYLLDVLINEPHKYEYFQGARVVPIFKRLGMDLEVLKRAGGVEKRIKDLLRKRSSEADSVLFEILTALLWMRNGYSVEFIPEKKGERTPDLVAKRNEDVFYVECKRQSKSSLYVYQETEKRQKMISHIGDSLLTRNILLDITFHVELETLSDTYLKELLEEKLKTCGSGCLVSNDKVKVDVNFVDIHSVKDHLKNNFVKHLSPTLNILIANREVDHKSFTCGILGGFFRVGEGEVNNLFISDIDRAFGVSWHCDADEAIWKKARDIKSQVHKAMNQFNSRDTAIIHIGIETLDGPEVERLRLEKITSTINSVDPNVTSLRWMFCHFFQSYTPPDSNWTFDETVSTISAYYNHQPPLKNNLMVVPEDGDVHDGLSHWDRPAP